VFELGSGDCLGFRPGIVGSLYESVLGAGSLLGFQTQSRIYSGFSKPESGIRAGFQAQAWKLWWFFGLVLGVWCDVVFHDGGGLIHCQGRIS
jgi:hypothetical protein